MTTKIVSWNIAKRQEPWHQLLEMDADVALLQEADEPPADDAGRSLTSVRNLALGLAVLELRWYEGQFPKRTTGGRWW